MGVATITWHLTTHLLQIEELRLHLRQETETVTKQRETVQALKQDVALHKTNSEELERRRQNDEAARVSMLDTLLYKSF